MLRLTPSLELLVRRALEEDIGSGDITSLYSIPPFLQAKARIVAQEELLLCGLRVSELVFKTLDKKVKFVARKKDGDWVKAKETIALIEARSRIILEGERVALNFLSHLSGIATLTWKFTQVAAKEGVCIFDTRKTIPGLRELQKYAVRIGGGRNHRLGLWDGILLKENHLVALGLKKKGKLEVQSLRNLINNIKKATHLKVEVEVETLKEFKDVLNSGADIILLDNFKPGMLKRAVRLREKLKKKVKLESSGGVTLRNIKNYARSGVDFISIGALTHSPQASDISLEIIA